MAVVTRNVVPTNMTPNQQNELDVRRAAARRTAWIAAGVALAFLVAFVLNIVLR